MRTFALALGGLHTLLWISRAFIRIDGSMLRDPVSSGSPHRRALERFRRDHRVPLTKPGT